MARELTYREAINEALRIEMRRDPNVILMGEDIVGGPGLPHLENDEATGGALGVTKGLVKEFGRRRILDTPISELGYIGAAVGAAMTGLRPVAELEFANFFGIAMDQIHNQAAKLRYMSGGKIKIPLVVRAPCGAGLGAAAQHSDCVYSMMTHIPGLKVVAPATPYDAKGLLISSIRDDDPVFFFEHMTLYNVKGEVPEEEYAIPLGKADVKREGRDVTVVAISKMVHHSLEAAESLAKDGIEVEVVDPRTLSPLDEEAIVESVRKTRRLVVVDSDTPRCGIAADIAALAADKCFDYLEAPVKMVTAPHAHVPFSPILEAFYIPSPEKIAQTVRSIV